MEDRMTAQQLKNSILQMAVQGKLVPQDPNDEPASVLLDRIRKEKEQLIKDGKIKKNKKESYIFRGADNLHYEQIGKEVRCIEDELPFEIPDSWEWTKLGNIGEWKAGSTPSKSNMDYYKNGSIPWLLTGDLNDGIIEEIPNKITEKALNETSVKLNPSGSILIAMYGATIGKLGILTFPATTNQACCACNVFQPFYNLYLFYFLMANKVHFVKQGEGGAQPNISREKIVKTLIPIPPINEQERIVNKLKELEPLIDKYKHTEEKLYELNYNIKAQLKKSILQYAIEGKLVPQNQNDEPASVLLDRIRKEKQNLIAEGKIKKDKNESIIYRRDNSYYEKCGSRILCIDEEIPFEIPNDWGWIRLGKLTYNHGQKKPNCDFCYIDIGSVNNEEQILNKSETVLSANKAPSRARKIVKFGDILYSTVRPYLHNMCIINRSFTFEPIASTGFAVLTCHSNYLNEFLFMYMMSPIFDEYANRNENSRGVAYPAINDSRLSVALIPVPPVSEQQRIIDNYKRIINILS